MSEEYRELFTKIVETLENFQENLRAKINDMLARIASLEDKVRELQYLLDVKE